MFSFLKIKLFVLDLSTISINIENANDTHSTINKDNGLKAIASSKDLHFFKFKSIVFFNV